MKHIVLTLILIFFLNCSNKKTVQLPEIELAKISEVKDVSVAYLFYDETQPDSVLLNRKNLISTTNWLVNVDKRLTLKQAIPHIKFLQDKKIASSHKNENAKNYFTCHDLRTGSLGFVEFTDVTFNIDQNVLDFGENLSGDQTTINISSNSIHNEHLIDDLNDLVKSSFEFHAQQIVVLLNFDKNMTFQEYIEANLKLDSLGNSRFHINNNQFFN